MDAVVDGAQENNVVRVRVGMDVSARLSVWVVALGFRQRGWSLVISEQMQQQMQHQQHSLCPSLTYSSVG